jgi:hypothetical protein
MAYVEHTDGTVIISKEELINMIPFVEGAVYSDEDTTVVCDVTVNVHACQCRDIVTGDPVMVTMDDDFKFVGWQE